MMTAAMWVLSWGSLLWVGTMTGGTQGGIGVQENAVGQKEGDGGQHDVADRSSSRSSDRVTWKMRHNAATYVAAIDVMVHLSHDQALQVQRLALAAHDQGQWDRAVAARRARYGLGRDANLEQIDGVQDVLLPAQRACLDGWQEWQEWQASRGRHGEKEQRAFQQDATRQMTLAVQARASVLAQVLQLNADQQQSLELISKRSLDRIVRQKVEAVQDLQACMTDSQNGLPVTEAGRRAVMNVFQTLRHPIAAYDQAQRRSQPGPFVQEVLTNDQFEALQAHRAQRSRRQAQFYAGTYVASWRENTVRLTDQQCVRLVELVARHLQPPFGAGVGRQQQWRALTAVPPGQIEEIIGLKKWLVLSKELPAAANPAPEVTEGVSQPMPADD
ncbi:MAG: hypothetical protein NXI04_17180 [Planctomycetaceae bacterium]|nr:hypothetical protein [Planctomycetaceae bacterium]